MSLAVTSRMNSIIRVSIIQRESRSVTEATDIREETNNHKNHVSNSQSSLQYIHHLESSNNVPELSSAEELTPLLSSPIMTQKLETRRIGLTDFIGLIYASMGGIVASQTLLLTKSGVDVILSSIVEKDFKHAFFAGMILILVILTVFIQVFVTDYLAIFPQPGLKIFFAGIGIAAFLHIFFYLFSCKYYSVS